MQGRLTKFRILFYCLLDGGQFILSRSHCMIILTFRVEWPGGAGSRLDNQNRAAPSGPRLYRAKKPPYFQGRLSA